MHCCSESNWTSAPKTDDDQYFLFFSKTPIEFKIDFWIQNSNNYHHCPTPNHQSQFFIFWSHLFINNNNINNAMQCNTNPNLAMKPEIEFKNNNPSTESNHSHCIPSISWLYPLPRRTPSYFRCNSCTARTGRRRSIRSRDWNRVSGPETLRAFSPTRRFRRRVLSYRRHRRASLWWKPAAKSRCCCFRCSSSLLTTRSATLSGTPSQAKRLARRPKPETPEISSVPRSNPRMSSESRAGWWNRPRFCPRYRVNESHPMYRSLKPDFPTQLVSAPVWAWRATPFASHRGFWAFQRNYKASWPYLWRNCWRTGPIQRSYRISWTNRNQTVPGRLGGSVSEGHRWRLCAR